jgi:hypothetical protein
LTFNNLNAIGSGSENDPIIIDADSNPISNYNSSGIPTGYYEFQGIVSNAQRIRIIGEVHLNLAANSVVTITGGIQCAEVDYCELTITTTGIGAQIGKLTATATDGDNAGIGGGSSGTSGKITITGGEITATGGERGAGIGGGVNGSGGEITITGGKITATGVFTGAGIGGGINGSGGQIAISGGQISAQCTYNGAGFGGAAGIGGGYHGDGGIIEISGGIISAVVDYYAAGIGGGPGYGGGEITISGNAIILEATGGDSAAGIGGGENGDGGKITISENAIISEATGGASGAGIGGGNEGDGGEITISGGEIESTGGDGGAGIGGGDHGNGSSTNKKISISGGTITARGTNGGAGIGAGVNGSAGEIEISDNAIIALAKGGNAAGIGAGNNGASGKITIYGGEIRAEGEHGAGIGGAWHSNAGEITIYGGIITATGGEDGAGIGGGYSGDGGSINIEGGRITATGDVGSAGIGGGFQGDDITINISGGTIKSIGKDGAAGIGVGFNGDNRGITKITGGSINATSTATPIYPVPTNGSDDLYLNTLTILGEFPNSLVTTYYESDYILKDVYTDADKKLYFYLPASSGAELVAVTFDDTTEGNEIYYGNSYTRSTGANAVNLAYLQFDEPIAAIDYENEILTGLKPDTNYKISISEELAPESFSLKPLSAALSNGAGTTPIDESWIGNDVDIIQTRIVPYGDSDPQVLEIPARPDATPALKALVSSMPVSEGTKGKVSGAKVGMAYSTNPNAAPSLWTNVDSEDDIDLLPGTYYFRKIADNDSFATDYVTVVIPAFPVPVAPDSPGELDLAATGLNLDLAYLLVVLLLMTVKEGIYRNTVSPNKKSL